MAVQSLSNQEIKNAIQHIRPMRVWDKIVYTDGTWAIRATISRENIQFHVRVQYKNDRPKITKVIIRPKNVNEIDITSMDQDIKLTVAVKEKIQSIAKIWLQVKQEQRACMSIF